LIFLNTNFLRFLFDIKTVECFVTKKEKKERKKKKKKENKDGKM